MTIERSRRADLFHWLSALVLLSSGAGSCSAVSPPDFAPLASLSDPELLAVCDDLRDPVTRFDRPLQCSDGRTVRLTAPSNANCRWAPRSECDATVGNVRACSAAVLADPCGAAQLAPDSCRRLADCDSSWITTSVVDECAPATSEEIASLSGVYAVVSRGLASCEPASSDEDAGTPAPRLYQNVVSEAPARGFLALQPSAGTPLPELTTTWCDDLETCSALVAGDAIADPSTLRAGERLLGCGAPSGVNALAARSPRSGDPCDVPARNTTLRLVAPGESVLETVTRTAPSRRDPRGCGFTITEPELYSPPCEAVEVYRLCGGFDIERVKTFCLGQ